MHKINEHYLYAGTIFAHDTPYLVITVLGSCVSVCLWDHVLRIGGINHFQLPLWNGEGLALPKYGNVAIEKLIDRMYSLGSRKKDLKAKIFGGGAVLKKSNGAMNIGERNIITAMDILSEERIPIISSAVGGHYGRKIKFYTETGVVLVKVVKEKSF